MIPLTQYIHMLRACTFYHVREGLYSNAVTTALSCAAEWWDSKFRYWSVWVVLRYTEVLMEPPSSLIRRRSKKGRCPSDSFSTVNWMWLLMLLRWLWKESTRSPVSTVQVLSIYHLRKRGVWKVDSTFCSMSSITKLVTTTDTSVPMAVPCTL